MWSNLYYNVIPQKFNKTLCPHSQKSCICLPNLVKLTSADISAYLFTIESVVGMINRTNKVFLIIGLIFLALFSLVAWMTSGVQGELIDGSVADWAAGIESPALLSIMKLISILGSTSGILVMTVLIGLVFLVKRNWNSFFFFFTVSVGGVILNFVLKMLIRRERPGDEVSNIEVFNFTFDIQSYSFPSGHTMRATIFFLFLIYLAARLLQNTLLKYSAYLICTVIIFLVALSRVLLDAHFVTDIIGAILMSIAWFSLCAAVFVRPKNRGYTYYINR